MALAANKQTKIKDGLFQSYGVAASTTIYAGSLVMANAAGNALPGADTAAMAFVGVATDKVNNSAGLAAALDVKVRRTGNVLVKYTGAAPKVGERVYLSDDETVAVAATTTNDITCGVATTLGAGGTVWIDIAK